MDQTVVNILVTVAGAAVGLWVKTISADAKDHEKDIRAIYVQMATYVPRNELEAHFKTFTDSQKEITKMLYEGFEEIQKEIAHLSRNQATTRALAESVQQRRGNQ